MYKVDLDDAKRLLVSLEISEKELSECVRKSANRAVRPLSMAIAREVSKDIQVELKYIRERIKTIFASKKDPSVGISVITRSFPAEYSLSRHQSGGKWVVSGRTHERSFEAKDKKILFKRRGKARLPIDRVTVDFPKDSELELVVKAHIRGFWDRFSKQLLYELKKAGGMFDD